MRRPSASQDYSEGKLSETLSIAQVVAAPWGSADESVRQAKLLAEALAARGHRVVVLAPGENSSAAASSRRTFANAKGDSLLPEPGGEPRVYAVGEALPITPRGSRTLSSGMTRAIEEALEALPLDIVHLHDPLPPSLPTAALRHSRALNVGHFHQPEPKFPASGVGKRVGSAFYGRLDAAICSSSTALQSIRSSVPAQAQRLLPALAEQPQTAGSDSRPVTIAFLASDERSSLRMVLRALRQLPSGNWKARIAISAAATPPPPLGSGLRDQVELVEFEAGQEEAFIAGSEIVVVAGAGSTPRPMTILRAVAAGAIPVASTLDAHEELLDNGRVGLAFGPSDTETLAAQLTALIASPERRATLVEAGSSLREQLDSSRLAEETEAIYLRLTAKRHDRRFKPAIAKRIANRPLIDVDLHMHTDHSYDCATPVEVLLAEARARGLGAIAVTDHNEISGALEARAKASGIKIIVGEEVKTAEQGEVIGLFIEELIPAGLTLEETLDRIHSQGGIAYVPHPFDRLHSVPDYAHLLNAVESIDAIEVHNARVAIGEFNEEAARFAAKYRIPAGAGSDAHVAQGLGSVRIRMRDFDGPEEFLESLREADIVRRPNSLRYVQALKFLQNKATPANARKASARRRVRRAARKS